MKIQEKLSREVGAIRSAALHQQIKIPLFSAIFTRPAYFP
jgi:hypothetical protein